MTKQRLLIAGVTGFIGRNLAQAFAQRDDFEVTGTYWNSQAPDIAGVKMLRADLTKREDAERVVSGADIIIQAAATTSGSKEILSKPYHHVTDNAVMNSLIFRSAFEHKVKQVLFFSCTVMYQSSDTPVKESDLDLNKPMNESYFGSAWTKLYIEKLCEFYSKISETKYTVIRHSNIYGPHDKFDLERSHVFGATITKVMRAENGQKIPVWGTGETERDLLYVSDLVNFVRLALDKQKSKFLLCNVGLGKAISVKDLVKKIITLSGKDLSIEFDSSKPAIKTKLCLNCEKAKEILGWEPKISLDEGINKTINWYKQNLEQVKV